MSNEKQAVTIEQVEHYKAYAVNHYKDLPLDVLKYITVLTEYSEQVKEQNKQLAEALQVAKKLIPKNVPLFEDEYKLIKEALTNYQKQTKDEKL